MHSDKNTLSIRLAEPVVSLRPAPARATDGEICSPAIVRGLLTLKLTRPTKISSIELELQAKATTQYARGAGPSRIEITEEYKVHSASTVVSSASQKMHRRAASARPRAPFLDLSRGGGRRQAPSGPHPFSRSASLGPPSLSARRQHDPTPQTGGHSQQDQILIDTLPPYVSQADRFSSVSGEIVGRSPSVASSSRSSGRLNSPVLSRRRLTPDIPRGSPVSAEHPWRDFALSRTSSIEEVPEDVDDNVRSDDVTYYGLSRIMTGSSSRSSEHDHRGRSHSRFSFGSIVHVLDAVKDRVRSRSRSNERGRSLAKGKGNARVGSHDAAHALPQTVVATPSAADGANTQGDDGWVVFPEGTYTYPIFFTISNDSSPTMKAENGSLIWFIKARVKRPGMFKTTMTAQKEVVVVRLLNDVDLGEVEGIDLQKEWEDQLQYRVQIAGRSFPVGGKIPFQLMITPLAKIKVHSISAYLDERTDYYARGESTRVRSDATRRATLLVIKRGNRRTDPILPLALDEPDAFYKSPLYRFLRPGENESEVESSYMGPGPWTICHQLSVPDSCSVLHPSNQTMGSNVVVNHTLEVTLRVEKEEEVKSNQKKKLYDIVIRIPVHILSCRCTSDWMSLPCYDEALRSEGDSLDGVSACPCRARGRANGRARRYAANTIPMERASTINSGVSDMFPQDSLISQTHLYEQLMSGLVSESGEEPPSYEYCLEAVYAQ